MNCLGKELVCMFWLWRASICKWVLLNHLKFRTLSQDYLPPFQVHHQAHFWWHWRHFLQKSGKTWLEPLRLLKQPSWCRPKREPNRPSYLDCKYCILAAFRKNTSKICLSPFCKFFFNVTSDTKKKDGHGRDILKDGKSLPNRFISLMIVFPNGVTPLSITRFLLLSLSEDSNLKNVQMNFCENQNDILSDDDVKRKCWKKVTQQNASWKILRMQRSATKLLRIECYLTIHKSKSGILFECVEIQKLL